MHFEPAPQLLDPPLLYVGPHFDRILPACHLYPPCEPLQLPFELTVFLALLVLIIHHDFSLFLRHDFLITFNILLRQVLLSFLQLPLELLLLVFAFLPIHGRCLLILYRFRQQVVLEEVAQRIRIEVGWKRIKQLVIARV